MLSQRALLVEFGPEQRLSSALQNVLNSHFQLSVVTELKSENALDDPALDYSFQDEINWPKNFSVSIFNSAILNCEDHLLCALTRYVFCCCFLR